MYNYFDLLNIFFYISNIITFSRHLLWTCFNSTTFQFTINNKLISSHFYTQYVIFNFNINNIFKINHVFKHLNFFISKTPYDIYHGKNQTPGISRHSVSPVPVRHSVSLINHGISAFCKTANKKILVTIFRLMNIQHNFMIFLWFGYLFLYHSLYKLCYYF